MRFRLIENWRKVLDRAWSIKFLWLSMLAAAVLTALEVIFPYVDIPHAPLLLGLISAAAFVARLIAQEALDDD